MSPRLFLPLRVLLVSHPLPVVLVLLLAAPAYGRTAGLSAVRETLAEALNETSRAGRLGRDGPGGQPRAPEPQGEPAGKVAIDYNPTGRHIRLLAEAQRAEQERQWGRAAELYQRLLDQAPDELARPSPRLFVPIRRLVEERLAGFPPAGLAAYRRQADPRARLLFEAGVRQGESRFLAEVVRRFLLSSVGDDALDRLATRWLARGQPGRALRGWRRLLRVCPDSDADPAALAVKIAACLARLGRLAEARRFLKGVAERLGAEAQAAVAGKRMTLSAFAGKLLEAAPEETAGGSWATEGGGADQCRRAGRPIRPGTLGWADAIYPREVARALRAWRGSRAFAPTGYVEGAPVRVLPIAAAGRVVYPSRTGLLARDALTGKLAWEWPWPAEDADWGSVGVFGVGGQFVGRWSCSSDGTRVFCSIPRLGATRRRLTAMRGELAAVALRSGETRWIRAVSDVLPGERGASGWFVSAPLPTDGVLVVGVRSGPRGGEYYLCGLNPEGRVLWHRFVAGRDDDPVSLLREDEPWFEGMPAASGGLAVVCAGGGVVAAVEAATGELRWLARYDQRERPFARFRLYSPRGWGSSTPAISAGVVYLTPRDSDFVYAIDLDTGHTLWRRERGGYSHLAGARDGKVFLAGDSACCIGPDGALEWERELPSKVVGRPLLAGHVLHLPLPGGLLYLDAATGAELGRTLWENWVQAHGPTWGADVASGDLAATEGRLLVATPHTINAYEPDEPRPALERLARERPDDPAVHLALGKEYQWEGDVARAGEEFEKAIAHRDALPKEELSDLRRRLAICYDYAAREHERRGRMPLALSALEAALRHATPGRQRTSLLLRAGALAARLRLWDKAVRSLQEVLSAQPPGTPSWNEARHTLDRALKRAGRGHYARLDAAAAAALGRGELAAVVERYPNSLSAPKALWALARQAEADGRSDEARLRLHELAASYPSSPLAPAALYRLAARYAGEGAVAMARGALDALSRRYPRWQAEVDGRRVSPSAALGPALRAGTEPARPGPPALAPPLGVRWQCRPEYASRDLTVVPTWYQGAEWLFVRAGRSFERREPSDGSLRWADRPGWIGVMIQDAMRPDGGVLVTGTVKGVPGSPAEQVGLRAGDILVGFDGKRLRDTDGLISACAQRRAGAVVKLEFLREGERHVVDLRLGERPNLPRDAALPRVRSVGFASGRALLLKGGSLVALDARDGARCWSVPLDGAGAESVVAGPALVAVADGAGRLRGLDAATGSELWRVALAEPTVHAMRLSDFALVVVSSRPATVRLLNPFDGTAFLRASDPHVFGQPVVALDSRGRACYAMGGRLGCLDARRGRALWSVQIANLTARRLWASASWVVVQGEDDRGAEVLECRRAESGEGAWSLALGRGESFLRGWLSEAGFFLATRAGARGLVRKLEASTGRVAWTRQLQSHEALCAWTAAPGAIILGVSSVGAEGRRVAELAALDPTTGEQVQRLGLGPGSLVGLVRSRSALYAIIEGETADLRPRQWLADVFAPEPPRFRVVRLTAGEPPRPGGSQ